MTFRFPAWHMGAAIAAVAGVAPVTPAYPQPVRTVSVGSHFDWSYAKYRSPARVRSGDVELTMQGRRDRDSSDLIVPVLTVAMPGHSPVNLEGSLTSETFDHRVTVGRWDSNRPLVLFQSFSGGAHCCNAIQLVVPEDGRLRVIDLGSWDGDYLEELPTDRNGDGRLDFVFSDNAFLYAFAPYAASLAPPKILNIVDGQAVDVSANPAFRELFEEALNEDRLLCLGTDANYEGMPRNGACAAYVASAARVGRFDEAWAEMLRSYDRDFDWTLPGGCRTTRSEGACLEDDTIEYDNYPDALRGFLVDLGYIDR